MLYLIRHGQTAANQAGLLQGRKDVPLNETGISQAEAAAKRLRDAGIAFAKVYTSPLSRAVQTAKIVAPGAACAADERLLEMDPGPYEGMSLANPAPEVIAFFEDFTHVPAPAGMESLESVVARMGEFLEEVREEAVLQDILISTHAIAMKGALEYLIPESKGSFWSKFLPNCGIYAVEVGEKGFGVPRAWPEAAGEKSLWG